MTGGSMPAEISTPLDPIMEVLRSETAPYHEAAEHHPFQTTLNKGKAPIEDYQRYLVELFHLHRALENQLQTLKVSRPALRAVLREYQYQVPYLLEDFRCFDIDPDSIDPSPPTRRAIDEIRAAAPASPERLLGMHYVLEGSKNGAKYISRNLAKAYGFENGTGLRYFDPYGEHQREYWAQFKADMNAQSFSETERAELVAGAVRMFEIIREISDGLHAPAPEQSAR